MSQKKKVKVYGSVEGYDKYAPFYDASNSFLDSFERYDLFEMLGEVSGKKVLDLGCGTGRMTANLVKFGGEVTGLDVSPGMIEVAKKNLRSTEFVVGDCENLPFGDASFDMVVATFLIVHLKEMRKCFDEVYRVLKPGGIFLVTNVNQRKEPKLETDDEVLKIESFYHRPENVTKELEDCFFDLMEERMVDEGGVWINQIVKAKK